jgi:hypothetical protein
LLVGGVSFGVQVVEWVGLVAIRHSPCFNHSRNSDLFFMI